jgi:O-antigen ligase
MLSRARPFVAPLYLFACLILGGSAQGIWQNMVLQLLGLALIAWAAMSRPDEAMARPARQVLLIAALGVAVVALQLIPLSPSLWAHGPRTAIAQGYAVLGRPLTALPLSVTPYATLNSLLGFIPPLALFCTIVRLRAYRAVWLSVALLAGAIAGIMLGAVQVASAGENSPWYLYRETNFGLGVGFFANANHMGNLMVISVPFLAASLAAGKSKNVQRYSALVAIAAGVGLILLVGIALNGSLAAYGLALPVIVASASIIIPPGNPFRRIVLGAALLLLVAATAVLAQSSIGATGLRQDASTAVQSRAQILHTSSKAVRDFMPLGSGLGSFVPVYQLYESPDEVTPTYVIHAHNDYVELALELGLAGVAVIALFLLWWGAAVWRLWTTAEPLPFARAASISSAAILAHSFVDYPLRTAAISACFAMCVALLADRRAAPVAEKSALRPARHLVFH